MQGVNSYLRLAMMFGGNQARTSNTNIEKMCELILLESYPKALTVGEIVDELLSKYSLNFADGEILDVLEGRRAQKNIICVNHKQKRIGDCKYTLSEEIYNKLESRERHSFTENVIAEFIKENNELGLSQEAFTDLLDRYFYFAFNNNANMIMGLLQPDFKQNAFISNDNTNFTNDEKEIINQFINWDNSEKDKCVYEMVSCCFDYCMLTARKGADDFHGVFNGKQFFLDANTIFRVIGINQDNRKRVIEAFLKKCEEVKIKICVSNFTVDEIENTIDYHVNHISSVLKGTAPLKPESINATIPEFINVDFYKCYCDWCSKPGNKPGDYETFNNYLKSKARKEINHYTSDTSASFVILSNETYNAYCESLTEYKKSRTWYVNENSIETDVNNFMRVVVLNDKNPSSNLFNANTYLISADHSFCDWAKIIRPGAVPLVVLPSVWYAIILQYNGRAEDSDYASFTRFLKLSLSSVETPNERWGRTLIDRVIALDEETDVKDKIIENVTHRLKSDMKDLDDEEEFSNLVEEEHRHVTELAVKETEDRLKAEYIEQSEAQKEEFNRRLEEANIKHESDINKMEYEREQLIQQGINKEIAYQEELKRKEIEGKKRQRDCIIDNESKRITSKKHTLYVTLFIIFLLLMFVPIVLGVYWILKLSEVSDGQKIAFGIIEGIISFLIIKFLFINVIYENWFCKLQSSEIDKRVRWKLERKYPKVEEEIDN